MIYLNILLVWCLINLPLTFIWWKLGRSMLHINLFFFAGVFLILIFGFVEAIRKDKMRNKR